VGLLPAHTERASPIHWSRTRATVEEHTCPKHGQAHPADRRHWVSQAYEALSYQDIGRATSGSQSTSPSRMTACALPGAVGPSWTGSPPCRSPRTLIWARR
jgi:hypothetical protein